MPCSICHGSGHNRTTCPSKVDPESKPGPSKNEQLKTGRTNTAKKAIKKKKPKKNARKMLMYVGQPIEGIHTARCVCGGITGIPGADIGGRDWGSKQWKAHQSGRQHQEWFERNALVIPGDEIVEEPKKRGTNQE